MSVNPADYNSDAINGEQLAALMQDEMYDRLKGDVPESLAVFLCSLKAQVDSLQKIVSAKNLGECVADSINTQSLKVGGADVADATDHTVTFSQASSRGTAANDFPSGSKLSVLFGKVRKWFADLGSLAFKSSVGDSDVASGSNLADAVSKRHSHSNKSVLDGITSTDVSNWNSKAPGDYVPTIGSAANVPLITGTGGRISAGSFGSAAGTFCQGDDYRLSNQREPTAHEHDNRYYLKSDVYTKSDIDGKLPVTGTGSPSISYFVNISGNSNTSSFASSTEKTEKLIGTSGTNGYYALFVGYRQFNSSYEVTFDCAWTKNGVTHESKITPATIFTTGTCTANGGFVGNLTGNADTASYSLNSGGVNGYTIEVLQASNIPMRISFI